MDRISQISEITSYARNPKAPIKEGDCPAVNLFELPDKVLKSKSRGGIPVYDKELKVAVEIVVAEDDIPTANLSLMDLLVKVQKAIFVDHPPNLGGKCSLIEEYEGSAVIRPETGSSIAAIGVGFNIRYIEDLSIL